jgi:hypothetical protein
MLEILGRGVAVGRYDRPFRRSLLQLGNCCSPDE